MRPIKFRAWDKDTNNWLEGVTYKLHTNGRLIVTPPHVELTQYTGLTDKTGKEVYEGDIVRCIHKTSVFITEVEFLNGMFCYDPKEHGNRHALILLMDYELEIIGNIYENSDLLETTT